MFVRRLDASTAGSATWVHLRYVDASSRAREQSARRQVSDNGKGTSKVRGIVQESANYRRRRGSGSESRAPAPTRLTALVAVNTLVYVVPSVSKVLLGLRPASWLRIAGTNSPRSEARSTRPSAPTTRWVCRSDRWSWRTDTSF
jgi:hypothetical protein